MAPNNRLGDESDQRQDARDSKTLSPCERPIPDIRLDPPDDGCFCGQCECACEAWRLAARDEAAEQRLDRMRERGDAW